MTDSVSFKIEKDCDRCGLPMIWYVKYWNSEVEGSLDAWFYCKVCDGTPEAALLPPDEQRTG